MQRCTSHPRAADSHKKNNKKKTLSLDAVDSLSALLLTQLSAQWLRAGREKIHSKLLKIRVSPIESVQVTQTHNALRPQTARLTWWSASCLTFSQFFYFLFTCVSLSSRPLFNTQPASLLSVGTQRPPPPSNQPPLLTSHDVFLGRVFSPFCT